MPDGEQDSVVPSGGTGGQGSSTRSNELLSAMDDKLQFLVDALRAEVEESKGREARLLSRISDLTDSICHLKDELLGVRKLAQITQDARHPIGINKAKENSKKSKKSKNMKKIKMTTCTVLHLLMPSKLSTWSLTPRTLLLMQRQAAI